MPKQQTDLSRALKSALDQGLISLRGIERETGIARNTARSAANGSRRPATGTEHLLWSYLREKGAA